MNKLQRGLAESVSGTVIGFVLITIVRHFVENGTLPGYSLWLFGLLSVVASIATLRAFHFFGLLYTIGWLLGALLLREFLGPVEIAFNIVGPIVIIVLRVVFWARGSEAA